MKAFPVMRAMRKSSTSRKWSAAAHVSGSYSRIQSSLGSVLTVWMGIPVFLKSALAPKRSRNHSFCASVRVSMPRMVGRRGRPAASTGVTASPCTDSPMAATSRTPAAAMASPIDSSANPQTASMSCSAQPGCGRSTGYSRLALASSTPSMSKTTALQPLVPTSSPIRLVMAYPCFRAAWYIASMRSGVTSGWMLCAAQKT